MEPWKPKATARGNLSAEAMNKAVWESLDGRNNILRPVFFFAILSLVPVNLFFALVHKLQHSFLGLQGG